MTQKRNLSWILCAVLVVLLTAMLLPWLLRLVDARDVLGEGFGEYQKDEI